MFMGYKRIVLLFIGLIWQLPLMISLSYAGVVQGMTDEGKIQAVNLIYEEYKKDFPAVTDITPTAAIDLMKRGEVVFVDVRTAEEQNVSMLPAAITKEVFLNSASSHIEKTVVAYCTIGYRSGVFAREMEAKGLQIRNLSGGIVGWTLAGGLLFENGRETRRVHVYGEKWNYAPEGYEPVVFGIFHKLFQ